MDELDDTDREILALLAADGRMPYSAIGEEVGLSGPAVSDRVERLRDAGILEGFTIAVDRGRLQGGVPLLVRVSPAADSLESLRDRLRESDAVEHVFVTSEGDVLFSAHLEGGEVRPWVTDLLPGEAGPEYSVTLLEGLEWTPAVDGVAFAPDCAECDNTVDREGETARFGGDLYHFCCSSCLARFEARYRRLEEGA